MTDANVVYFVSDGGAAIKIGSSSQVGSRFRALNVAASKPLTFIGCIAGGFEEERILHGRLAAYRLHGEWFADCPAVRAVIETAISEGLPRASVDSALPVEPQSANEDDIFGIFTEGLVEAIRTNKLGRLDAQLEAARMERIHLEGDLERIRGGQ